MNVLTRQRGMPGWLSLALVVTIIPMGLIAWGYTMFVDSDPSSASVSKPHELSAIELYVQAQEFVRQGLKAPSTAEFPLEPVSVGTDGNGLYQVESYVDSQNSFGAMIRSHWMLNMRPVGDKWMLETMQIDGKIVYDIARNE